MGDAVDFGDLTEARRTLASCSSSTRGIFGGGVTPTRLNTIDFIVFASTGNAQDFGDLTTVMSHNGGCSDAHGGLGD